MSPAEYFTESKGEFAIGGDVDFPHGDSVTIGGRCLAMLLRDLLTKNNAHVAHRPLTKMLVSAQIVHSFNGSRS